MTLMKTAIRKREPGAGNPQPVKRQPFPEIQQQVLNDALDNYVREIGCKESFNLYAYANLTPQQAEHPRSLFKLNRLLKALLGVSPITQIKYVYLKAAMSSLMQTFGDALFCHFQCQNKVEQGLQGGRCFGGSCSTIGDDLQIPSPGKNV